MMTNLIVILGKTCDYDLAYNFYNYLCNSFAINFIRRSNINSNQQLEFSSWNRKNSFDTRDVRPQQHGV